MTVVEWGTGLAEHLADSRLEIDIRRTSSPHQPAADDVRMVLLRGIGARWGAAERSGLNDVRTTTDG